MPDSAMYSNTTSSQYRAASAVATLSAKEIEFHLTSRASEHIFSVRISDAGALNKALAD
jgi:hypothetical protein